MMNIWGTLQSIPKIHSRTSAPCCLQYNIHIHVYSKNQISQSNRIDSLWHHYWIGIKFACLFKAECLSGLNPPYLSGFVPFCASQYRSKIPTVRVFWTPTFNNSKLFIPKINNNKIHVLAGKNRNSAPCCLQWKSIHLQRIKQVNRFVLIRSDVNRDITIYLRIE